MPHSVPSPAKNQTKTSATTPKSATQKALEKLGLKRDIDLALHLPLALRR
jgi:ATP-dependent DNA helicase RecG